MKLILIFIYLTLTSTAFANEKKTYTLKSVMQDLSQSMETLNRGIFYEDFKLIEEAASRIVNHPKPKDQLTKIIKILNFRMLKFKSFDGKVHDSAVDLVELAKKKDMDGILSKHRILMNNCVGCHTQFKAEISKAFLK